ncbi:SPOR domain-containing protein [Cognatishimia sp.]|uniref:SPOR domain-containing protein n=1 Tax=Cognatishimia sp. TaxID=2211648 RepID=UPI003514CC95
MQFRKTLSYTLLAALTLASAVDARSLRDDGVPAEVPPASFKGNQYVDSRGCVFIRAGVDGSTSWVPRVTRDRKLVCGLQPTNVAGTTAVAAVADEPEIIEITPQPTAKPDPVVVAAPKPKPAPVRVATPRKAPARPVVVHQPAAIAPMPQVAQVGGNCTHLSAQSRQYLAHPTADVRCGSQTNPLSGGLIAPSSGDVMPSYQDHNGNMVVAAGVYPGQTVKTGTVAGNTRVIPQHLYQSHQEAKQLAQPPEGYRMIWKDDRLNPNRGVQTINGQQAMASVWDTSKTPMTAHKNTRVATQSTVSTRGTGGNTMVITPNTYVQVAAYGSSEDAQRVARRVRSMGLPVRIGKQRQGFQDIRMVLAGPFYSYADAQSALAKAQSAGFQNAYIK